MNIFGRFFNRNNKKRGEPLRNASRRSIDEIIQPANLRKRNVRKELANAPSDPVPPPPIVYAPSYDPAPQWDHKAECASVHVDSTPCDSGGSASTD